MKKLIKPIRWIARILALITGGGFITLILFMSIGSLIEGKKDPMEVNAILQLSLGIAGCLSMLIAWKWEFVGGAFSILCYAILGFINPKTFPLIQSIFMPAGILFIITWILNLIESKKSQIVH